MRQIQLTRKAIKDLQRLQSKDSIKIPERLFWSLAETGEGEQFSYTKHLSGYANLWRSRLDFAGGTSLRLIWTENPEDSSIRFLYVAPRNDRTYELDLNSLPREPAYSWNGEMGVAWSLFLNGQYKTSPILTQDRRKTSNKVGDRKSYSTYGANEHIGFFAHITQSPRIKAEWWDREFNQRRKLSRSKIADLLRQKWERNSINYPTQDRFGTVLIIDESQDYLLGELNAIKALCRSWHQAQHLTHLWLLGDLNQRIMPVDFDWGALKLVRPEEPGWKCLRNSSNILKFSNLFLTPVREISQKNKTRSPYQPTDPDKSYEIGERVKLLTYPSLADAETFLEQLSQSLGSKLKEVEKSHSLTYKLASRVKILQSEIYQSQYSDRLEFLNVHQVKGREFDSCIVFNVLGCDANPPTSEDWWQWYTLLTRTRSRLMVIATYEQYDLLLKYIPDLVSECDRIDCPTPESIESEIKWIQEESNDLEFSGREADLVKRYLCEAVQTQDKPLIYWDTYEVLERTNIKGQERTNLEEEMILDLKKYDSQVLLSEIKVLEAEKVNPSICSLILRALDRYWDATGKIIAFLQQDNPAEYQRIVEAVAQSLESHNLIVEAARIRFQRLDIPYPDRFPLPEIATVKGDLFIALTNIFKSRFPK